MADTQQQTLVSPRELTRDLRRAVAYNKTAIKIFVIAVLSVCMVLMIIAAFADYQISNALYNPAQRFRFRDLGAYYPDSRFTRWFVINGVNGHEAFFSGHVLSAASLSFAWLIVPVFGIKNKIARFFIFAVPPLFAVSMMYGRIVTGAHYLSDVVFSIIMLLSMTILLMKVMFWAVLTEKQISMHILQITDADE